MRRCWEIDPQRRPTARQVIDELEQGGLGTRNAVEGSGRTTRMTQQFRYAMMRKQDTSIDLVKIEQILNEASPLCCYALHCSDSIFSSNMVLFQPSQTAQRSSGVATLDACPKEFTP